MALSRFQYVGIGLVFLVAIICAVFHNLKALEVVGCALGVGVLVGVFCHLATSKSSSLIDGILKFEGMEMVGHLIGGLFSIIGSIITN